MALNPFFLQGSPNEQRLVQDLINEQLKILNCTDTNHINHLEAIKIIKILIKYQQLNLNILKGL